MGSDVAQPFTDAGSLQHPAHAAPASATRCSATARTAARGRLHHPNPYPTLLHDRTYCRTNSTCAGVSGEARPAPAPGPVKSAHPSWRPAPRARPGPTPSRIRNAACGAQHTRGQRRARLKGPPEPQGGRHKGRPSHARAAPLIAPNRARGAHRRRGACRTRPARARAPRPRAGRTGRRARRRRPCPRARARPSSARTRTRRPPGGPSHPPARRPSCARARGLANQSSASSPGVPCLQAFASRSVARERLPFAQPRSARASSARPPQARMQAVTTPLHRGSAAVGRPKAGAWRAQLRRRRAQVHDGEARKVEARPRRARLGRAPRRRPPRRQEGVEVLVAQALHLLKRLGLGRICPCSRCCCCSITADRAPHGSR